MEKTAIHNLFKPSLPTVSFNQVIVIHEIMNLSEFTPDERNACWFSVVEFSQIRSEAKAITDKISKRQEKLRHDENICTRGLECRSPARSMLRSQVRMRNRLAVFEEQELQRQLGFKSDERIAFVSNKQTFSCQVKAQKVGALDCQAACEAWLLHAAVPPKIQKRDRNAPRSPLFARGKSLRRLHPRLFQSLPDSGREL